MLRTWAGKEFPDRVFQNSEFTEKRRADLVRGAENTAGRLPDRRRRADPFRGLAANFYSLKKKKIPAGRMELGDWSGCYMVNILPNMESGSRPV